MAYALESSKWSMTHAAIFGEGSRFLLMACFSPLIIIEDQRGADVQAKRTGFAITDGKTSLTQGSGKTHSKVVYLLVHLFFRKISQVSCLTVHSI